MELVKKLNYKESLEVCVLNAPEAIFPFLHDIAHVTTSLSTDSHVPFLLGFVSSKAELSQMVKTVMKSIDTDTILWFAYPKKASRHYRSDINRDTGWELLGSLGYEPVRQISLDEDWSALRFRHVSKIKKLTRSRTMALSEEAKQRLQDHD
jgi:hypothetical protein